MSVITTVPLSLKTVIAAVEEAVAKNGAEYVYPNRDLGCSYVRDGAPSCLVGHALHSLGLPLDELSRYEGISARGLIDYLVMDGYVAVTTEGEYDAIQSFLQQAQGKQDTGNTWGDALNAAREELGLVTA